MGIIEDIVLMVLLRRHAFLAFKLALLTCAKNISNSSTVLRQTSRARQKDVKACGMR